MNNLQEQFEHRMTMCYYGDDIYLLDEGLSMDSVMPLVAGREIMTDKIVCLLCQSGTLDLHLNYHHLLLTAGQVLIALPGMIINTREASPDFRAITMLLSERFTNSLNLGSPYRTLLSVQRQPVTTLAEGMEDALLNFIGMVRGLLNQPSHPNLDRVLPLLFEAWFYGFGPYFHSSATQLIVTAAELHTEQFLRLVEQHFRQHTSLDWYASQLNISSKRLSICVKQTSGHTPTEWIDRHRLHQAVQLLHSGNQTIKEIASELGFPNQSTFGTWFKRQTSQCPRNFSATHQAAASNTNYTYIHFASDKQ